jgi:hypothetical protein
MLLLLLRGVAATAPSTDAPVEEPNAQGFGTPIIAPSRKKLRRMVEDAEVAVAAERGVIALEGGEWSDEVIP